jgi:hypothetical protein
VSGCCTTTSTSGDGTWPCGCMYTLFSSVYKLGELATHLVGKLEKYLCHRVKRSSNREADSEPPCI